VSRPAPFVYHHRTQGRGGEGVHISHVVRALEAAGHPVEVVSPPAVDPLRTAGLAPVDKSETRVSGLGRVWRWISRHSPQVGFEALEIGYNLYAAARLRRVLPRQAGGSVFYERYAFFLSLSSWLAKRRGMVVMLEVNEVAGVQRARGLVLERLARWIERTSFRRADAVLVVSSFLADEVRRRGGREGRVHVIPNAVEAAAPAAPGRGAIRQTLGLNGSVVIGFVGWFDRWDRLDLLVEVFHALHRRRPEARLLLVGDGPVAGPLRSEISRRGLDRAVVLTGPVPRPDVARHLEAMDIGVLPSSNAFGSPIALFEMMAAGKPVVAPDVAPVLDVLEPGVTGLVVPLGDREALGAALDRLVADAALRERLGAAAREKIAANHTWAANARRIIAIADDCLGGAA
jgi:glycosyltransferase involved in cell wall biosynthesis